MHVGSSGYLPGRLHSPVDAHHLFRLLGIGLQLEVTDHRLEDSGAVRRQVEDRDLVARTHSGSAADPSAANAFLRSADITST